MKKVLFLMMLSVMVSTVVNAQNNNATLLQPADSYFYYGDQVMNKKQCVEFLSTRHQPAYETFQNGYKCYQAGWGLFGAGLGVNLIGSIIIACGPEEGNAAMLYSGLTCLGLGAAAILASVPTVFIGYARLNKGVDMFNRSQAAATTQAYWTIQGSENGLGLALHF
jgi:hypothetical protein